MELFLIRHLITDFNRQGILQGSQDLPILEPSAEVWEQIKLNQHKLNQYGPFDAILVSEYQRTRMTAECYGFDEQILEENLLNELNFGRFEGRKKTELLAEHEEQWKNNPQDLVLGEPITKLAERVMTFIESYQSHKRVLMFGHGSWSRAICSIVKYGNINKMNQITIANNDLVQLKIP